MSKKPKSAPSKKPKRVGGVTYRDDGNPRWEVRIRWQSNGQSFALPIVHYPVDPTAPVGADTHKDRAEQFAIRYAEEKLREVKSQDYNYSTAAHHYTLGDVLQRFIEEVESGQILTKQEFERRTSNKEEIPKNAVVKKSTRVEVSTAKVFLGRATMGHNKGGFPELCSYRLDQLKLSHFYDLSDTNSLNWQYKDRNGGKASNSSIKRALTAIRTILNHAIKYWKIDFTNPLKSLTEIQVRDKREVTVDADKWSTMIEQLNSSRTEEVIVYAIRFMRQTAARRSEVCDLTWKGVDINKKTATFFNTKSQGDEVRNRTIPLNIEALEIIKNLSEIKKGPYVFSRKNGKAVSPDSITQAWGRARKKCAELSGDDNFHDIRIHDLRHTRITELGSFLSAAEASAVSGHRDFGTFIRYFNPNPEDIGKKIDAIENSKSEFELSELSDKLSALSIEDMTAIYLLALQKKMATAGSFGK